MRINFKTSVKKKKKKYDMKTINSIKSQLYAASKNKRFSEACVWSLTFFGLVVFYGIIINIISFTFFNGEFSFLSIASFGLLYYLISEEIPRIINKSRIRVKDNETSV